MAWMKWMIVVVILCTSCVQANRVGLAVAEMSIACDWRQTRGMADGGWYKSHEANPLLGRKPSVNEVDAYMMASMTLLAVIHTLLPKRWRAAAWLPIIAYQTHTIVTNAPTTGLCW